MNEHVHPEQERDSQAATQQGAINIGAPSPTMQMLDLRPEAIVQRQLGAIANDAVASAQTPIQRQENKTGLPNNLKAGIENLSGYSMDDVKVHSNSDKPAQLNAHAYAQGTDIHLAPGQEKHLPHEAWHVVQQKQGRVKPTMQMKGKVSINDDEGLEREADVMGVRAMQLPTISQTLTGKSNSKKYVQQKTRETPHAQPGIVIQRALKGSHAALVAVEEEKGFRLLKTRGTWTSLLQEVAAFEVEEAKATPTGDWAKRLYINKLLKKLELIETTARKWIRKHEDETLAQPGVDPTGKSGDFSGASDEAKTDLSQLAAIRNLLRRVAWERMEITKNQDTTKEFSDATTTAPSVDNAVGGQASRLDKLEIETRVGYYQPDAMSADVQANASAAIGIPGFDPNWSGRSMAAARIDQLLTSRFETVSGEAQVPSLVKMDFATHTRTPVGENQVATATTGVFLEEAAGQEMRSGVIDTNQTVRSEQDRTHPAQLAFDDPILQRSLNRLQLLDAICGQVDRHTANLFVNQDANGQVTGVQGIDNDMAFGSRLKGEGDTMREPEQPELAQGLANESRAWRGLPPIADEQIALAILSIKPEDIQIALTGLIQESEITATISRLAKTQAFLKGLDPTLLIAPGDWDARRQELSDKQQKFNSYLGEARTESLGSIPDKFALLKALEGVMEERQPTSRENRDKDQVVPEWYMASFAIVDDIANLVGKGTANNLAVTQGEAIARDFASRINVFPVVDRTLMTLKKSLESVDSIAYLKALESSRKAFYG